MNKFYSAISVFALFLASCDNANNLSGKKFEPIILGDSSTIVTETDADKLKNIVNDVEYATTPIVAAEVIDNVVKEDAKPETTQTPTPEPAPKTEEPKPAVVVSNNGKQLSLNIGNNTQIILSGITTKEFKSQDPSKVNDLSYLVTAGDINKITISVTNGKLKAISQRYQSTVGLNVEQNLWPLKSLGTKTSDWATKKVNGTYTFSENGKLVFNTVSAQKLKDAAQKMLQQKKYKKEVVNNVLNKIGNKANPNTAPFSIIAQNYQFQIEGTDSKGKAFQKIIRLDLN